MKKKYPDGGKIKKPVIDTVGDGISKKKLADFSKPVPKAPVQTPARSLTETASQFIPVYESYLDMKDIYNGAKTGDKEVLNRGVLGLGFPAAGKAIMNTLDYATEKTLGKKTADDNASKRNGIINMSTADLQKLYIKYGAGGYDQWVADGSPTLKNGGIMKRKKKAEWGAMIEDESPLLKRVDMAQPQLAQPQAAPTGVVDTKNLGGSYNGVKASGSDKDNSKKSKGSKYGGFTGGGHSFSVGAGIQAMEGIISSLMGPDQPRRVLDDSLSYNPFPQGTGSQAIFAEGGTVDDPKKKGPKLVKQVPPGYEPIPSMPDHFQKKVVTPGGTIKPKAGPKMSDQNWKSFVANKAPTASADTVYIQRPQAAAPVKPVAAFDGEPVYNGNKLSFLTQMQTRKTPDNNQAGSVNTSKSMAVMHPVFPNTANPNMDETYEVPAETYQYFTGGSNRFIDTPQRRDSLQTFRTPAKFDKGGRVRGTGSLQLLKGAAPVTSVNPFDGGSGEFQGASHEDGGIPAMYNGKPFEAEGGEPYRIDPNGNLEIFGNLVNPITGNKFKKDGKAIAKKEKKANEYIDLGLENIQEVKGKSKFDNLRVNAGNAMLSGGLMKQRELAESKEHLSAIQKAVLKTEGKQEYARNGGIFRDGGLMEFGDGGKPWKYKGTKKDKLDQKIQGFVKLVEEKGLEGYSGSKSGYDKRNTKSGRPSRHGQNQALDMIFKDSNAYQTIMKDPELSSYLYENGLTAIDEYDPEVAKKTGATTGHLHIGYDKGTKTSDRFRNDYRAAYPSNKKVAGSINPTESKPYPGASIGDAFTENPDLFTPPKITVGTKAPAPSKEYPDAPTFTAKKTEAIPFKKARNSFPWEQIAPAIPQLFDTPDFVEGQTYTPDLFSPYQVSFQDRINQNASSFNTLAQAGSNNPEALAIAAAQQYSANAGVKADEFRTNQGIWNEIENKNNALLNDAKQKNIQLRDTQFVRQSEARSNTKNRRIDAGIQIGDIIAKNKLENKTLAVTEQLYKDYAFDDNMQLQYVGGQTASDQIDESFDPMPQSRSEVTTTTGNTKTKNVYERFKPEPMGKPVQLLDNFRKKPTRQGALAKLLYNQF